MSSSTNHSLPPTNAWVHSAHGDRNAGGQLHIEASPSAYPMSSQQTAALAGLNNSGSRASDDEGMELMDVFEGAENNFAQDSSNLSNLGPSWYQGNDSELNS